MTECRSTPLSAHFSFARCRAFGSTLSDSRRSLALLAILMAFIAAPARADSSDLLLTLSASPTTLVRDQELRLEVSVSNLGPDLATDVQVEFALPAALMLLSADTPSGSCLPGNPVLCQLGNLDSIDASRNATVLLVTRAVAVADISLEARLSASSADPDSANNAATAALSILAPADASDLRLDLLVGPVVQTNLFGVTAILVNDGPQSAGEVTTSLQIPQLTLGDFHQVSVSYVRSGIVTQNICRTALDDCAGEQCLTVMAQMLRVDCEHSGLGVSDQLNIDLLALPNLALGATLSVSASVTGPDLADPNPDNNRVEAQRQVQSAPVVDFPTPEIDIPIEGPPACFIATAAFGSPYAAEVQRLRDFRDRALLTNAPGRWLVGHYYRLSPPWADWLRQHSTARQAVALALGGMLWLARPLPLFGLGVLGILLLGWRMRRRTSRPDQESIHSIGRVDAARGTSR